MVKIKSKKILLVGDFMLDTYTIGKVRRISPEAPVPVLHVTREEKRPGGAGNVALNLISLGMEVILFGRIGADSSGEVLKAALAQEGADIRGLFIQDDFPTPMKNRVVADNQQIVRVDYEKVIPLSESIENKMIAALAELMDGVAIVAVSDYGKGTITAQLMSAIVKYSNQNQKQVIVDPKGVNFAKYSGSHIIKPNLTEVYAAANLPIESPLETAAERILAVCKAETLMITMAEDGISLFHENGLREDFPVQSKHEVKDVTGAGDTVLASLACFRANGLTIQESSRFANVAAGIAIEHFGCARVTLSDIEERVKDKRT